MRRPNRSSGAVCTGDGTARPVAPQMMMASASRTMPNPIVPISIRSKSLFSSGRSTRSMTRPISAVTTIATTIGDRERQLGRQVEGGGDVGADHHHVAVREVDQAHRAVDEGEAQRDQGVDGAEAEPADDRLEEDLHGYSCAVRSARGRPVQVDRLGQRPRACRLDRADRGGEDADTGVVVGEVAEQALVLAWPGWRRRAPCRWRRCWSSARSAGSGCRRRPWPRAVRRPRRRPPCTRRRTSSTRR